jgi:hypothetical protein
MNMPGFTAEQSLQRARGHYRSGRPLGAPGGAVVPAIPRCSNCENLLEYCATHHGMPRAACAACASGHCDSSEENPGGHCRYDPILNRRICDL